MAGQRNKNIPLDERRISGLKYFQPLSQWLSTLHDAGCQRDRAGNRRFFMDQYLSLVLLYMFNPICSSMRSLQRAGELPKIRRKLGVGRVSLGSFSEAAQVFDASLLEPVIEQLSAQVGAREALPHDARLGQLGAVLTLVDGTHLSSLSRLARSLWIDEKSYGVKAHVQYELLRAAPSSVTLTEARGCEKAQLAATLEAGRLYVLDRGYAKYELFQDIIDADSQFVCRIKNNAVIRELIQERELDDDTLAAGVVRDVVVELGTPHHRRDLREPVRLVTVKVPRHDKRGGEPITLTLATNRLDLPADVIALIYRLRWQVELFFRFFKHVLGCRHLISHSENGIRLQVYAAIIACLLITLYTGRKPNKASVELFGWYALGLADDEDLLRHLPRLQKQST